MVPLHWSLSFVSHVTICAAQRRKEIQVVHLCLDMLYSLAALQKCTALFLQICKSTLWNSSRSSWWPTAGDLSFQSKPPFSKGSNLKPTSIHRPQSKHTQQGDHHYENKKKKKPSLLHKVTRNIKYTFEKKKTLIDRSMPGEHQNNLS